MRYVEKGGKFGVTMYMKMKKMNVHTDTKSSFKITPGQIEMAWTDHNKKTVTIKLRTSPEMSNTKCNNRVNEFTAIPARGDLPESSNNPLDTFCVITLHGTDELVGNFKSWQQKWRVKNQEPSNKREVYERGHADAFRAKMVKAAKASKQPPLARMDRGRLGELAKNFEDMEKKVLNGEAVFGAFCPHCLAELVLFFKRGTTSPRWVLREDLDSEHLLCTECAMFAGQTRQEDDVENSDEDEDEVNVGTKDSDEENEEDKNE